MAQLLGAEINEFLLHGWPDGYIWDNLDVSDELLTVKGRREDLCEPTRRYTLADFGELVREDGTGRPMSFQSAVLKWLHSRKFATLLVEMPRGREKELRQWLKVHGGRTVKGA